MPSRGAPLLNGKVTDFPPHSQLFFLTVGWGRSAVEVTVDEGLHELEVVLGGLSLGGVVGA